MTSAIFESASPLQVIGPPDQFARGLPNAASVALYEKFEFEGDSVFAGTDKSGTRDLHNGTDNNGEGKTFIGDILVTTNANGTFSINDFIAVKTVPVGQSITATATKFAAPETPRSSAESPGPSGRLPSSFERGGGRVPSPRLPIQL